MTVNAAYGTVRIAGIHSYAALQAGRFTVRGTFTSAFPAEVVWKVITDYDRLSQVYSSIVSSRTRTVDNQLQIIQVHLQWKKYSL